MPISERYRDYLQHFGPTTPVIDFANGVAGHSPVVLRHDVDHSIDIALMMAHFEHANQRRSTYYMLHTADYMNDPLFFEKCLQIQDYGHEIGIHTNYLTLWMSGQIDDVRQALLRDIDLFDSNGVTIRTVAAHGDKACYDNSFANYWLFSNLRPEDPLVSENGITAEGVASLEENRSIAYPREGHRLRRADGEVFDLWSLDFAEFGLVCEASRLSVELYFSDSGGSWKRSKDPLSEPMSSKSALVLMHPLYWTGKQKHFYFLSTARAGSKWLASFLEEATSVTGRHEFTLNHAMRDGELVFWKSTGAGFTKLLDQPNHAQRLIVDVLSWVGQLMTDYAEANVYLEQFVDLLPDDDQTILVHLYREPTAVARSLMERNWYRVSPDDRHPPVNVEGWSSAPQFEQICLYVKDVNDRLLARCNHRLQFEKMVEGEEYITAFLERLGIAVYPRLAKRLIGKRINATENWTVPGKSGWSGADRATFERICGPISRKLGYVGANALEEAVNSQLEPRTPKREMVDRQFAVSTLLTTSQVLSPGQVAGRNCQIKILADGIQLNFNLESNGHVLLGGGSWRDATGGWRVDPLSTYTIGIELSLEDVKSRVRILCLTYSNAGNLIGRTDLATLSQSHSAAYLHFMPVRAGARFNIALYAAAGFGSGAVLHSITLAAASWLQTRGVEPQEVLRLAKRAKQRGSAQKRLVLNAIGVISRWSLQPEGVILDVDADSGRDLLRVCPRPSGPAMQIYGVSGRWLTEATNADAFEYRQMYRRLRLRMYRWLAKFRSITKSKLAQNGILKCVGPRVVGFIEAKPLSQSGRSRVSIATYDKLGLPFGLHDVGFLSERQQIIKFDFCADHGATDADICIAIPRDSMGVEVLDLSLELTP